MSNTSIECQGDWLRCPRTTATLIKGKLQSTPSPRGSDHPTATAHGHAITVPRLSANAEFTECRIVDRIPAGDHHIVLAAPERGGHGGRDQPGPLLYHDRRYTSVTEPRGDEARQGISRHNVAEPQGS
ncbi:flavin reductase [Streptomyces sp. LBL]|uniref:flavin reductase n=1 Tax=Streptomyces sp. LBL TaxID=2940562 RepID=UPI002477007E|nr:flavin reductase [Streptomyces sp. LBL]